MRAAGGGAARAPQAPRIEARVSLINRMLQDLDRREALHAGEAKPARASSAKPARSEWFWRALAVLLTAALAWLGWVAIQLLPRKPLVTELAYRAASDARARGEVKPAAPAPVAQIAVAAPVPAAPVPERAPVAAAPSLPPFNDSLRLETELRAPRAERAPPVVETPKLTLAAPVTRRPKERLSTAETHFRRATVLLKDARVGEAEEHLEAALQADPTHTAARQAYVSLLLDQQRVSTARGLLLDALAADPAQASFALALARIYAQGRDYAGALAVLDRAASGGQGPAESQAFRGAMLQRLGRHDEALDAYQSAVREGRPPASTWIGYAISLEALGKRSEATQAYRRALTAGPITAEAREYAESRARALE
jgi:MSHA biogenesis protein MshN